MNQEQNSQILVRAISLHQSGDLDAAASLYRQVLEIDPRNAKAQAMLGLERLQRGELQEGIDFLRASLEAQSNQPDTLNNLGRALQLSGELEAALEALERALALAPNYLGALFNRGNVLHDLKRYAEAAASFERLTVQHPNHTDARLNLGMALRELGRKQEALIQFDQVAAAEPYRADVHCNRGSLLQEMRRHKEALASYEKAIRLAPDLAEAHNGAGIALRKLNRYAEALECHDRLVKLRPEYADAYCQHGKTLQELSRHEEALADYDHAIALDPERSAAYVLRAELHMEQGRLSEAERDLEAAIGIDPKYPSIYGPLMSLKKCTATDPRFRQLQALYENRQKLRQDEIMELGFAMGRALEKQGRYDEAFAAYAEGNRLHHHERPFAEEADAELSDWIASTFSHELFEKYEQAAVGQTIQPDLRTPIFIVGMPRSGSTLVEQILASHPQVFGAGELPAMSQATLANQFVRHNETDWTVSLSSFRKMGQQYLDEVWKLAPEAHYITDKMPSNFRYLGLAHLMLPNAKFIHITRDPMDTCFSCFSLLFSGDLDFAYDLGVLGRYYSRYAGLMQHWHRVLPSERILDVCYEDVVEDIEAQARRILEFVGLAWDPACLKFYETERSVSTASVTQVRQPLYSDSVARWKNFEKHLRALEEIVEQVPPFDEHA